MTLPLTFGTVPVLRLPDPMLSYPGPLPSGSGWSYELKWDGIRAAVCELGFEGVVAKNLTSHLQAW